MDEDGKNGPTLDFQSKSGIMYYWKFWNAKKEVGTLIGNFFTYSKPSCIPNK